MSEISKCVHEWGISNNNFYEIMCIKCDEYMGRSGTISRLNTLEAENAALKAELKNARELIGMTPSAPEVEE